MVRIEVSNPADHIPSIAELARENWLETGFDFEINPSVEIYQAAVDAGILFALGVFDGDEVVGYCSMMIAPHAHNPAIIMASSDTLFVRKDYRRGTIPARLIKAAEDEAKRRGASRVNWHTRAGTSLAAMLERRGYKPADVIVTKEL
jgi:GNAT superfamily N-acetyltransferase